MIEVMASGGRPSMNEAQAATATATATATASGLGQGPPHGQTQGHQTQSSVGGLQNKRSAAGTLHTNVGNSQFFSKVGIVPICEPGERGALVKNMTASLKMKQLNRGHDFSTKFPKMEDCAHFHYDLVELGTIQLCLCEGSDDIRRSTASQQTSQSGTFNLRVLSNNKSWIIKRTYENFRFLDKQLHKCIFDRKVSSLQELIKCPTDNMEELKAVITKYLSRFSTIAGERLFCGPVLNWLEMDNRGNRLLVTDDSEINTPAIAAAHVTKAYLSQATDEICLEVGDIISVIDMPPTEDATWWRGKNKKFEVGYFPCDCVEIIGDKFSKVSTGHVSPDSPKPVLRKRGKLITFLQTFFNKRPTRSTLKQSGIVKERVFGCDLGEHLLNSGHEVPLVLFMCMTAIEEHGLVDGIYRLSGVASNIQKLRLSFDEDKPPDLADERYIRQDIHSISSLLKMYFRELPNPLLTYQLYDAFAKAVRDEGKRLKSIYDIIQQLPPPHYRTASYLFKHLNRVSNKGKETGMHCKNLAIVWAPNLMRSKDLEEGGSTAVLKGVGIQAVVTECLIKYADAIFGDNVPSFDSTGASPKKSRPKSLAISTPSKLGLVSLEEARELKAMSSSIGSPIHQTYIDVGAGPQNLPKYHAVINLPSSRKRSKFKKSPSGSGWKSFFGKDKSKKHRKTSMPNPVHFGTEGGSNIDQLDSVKKRKLLSVRSVDSLLTNRHSTHLDNITIINPYADDEDGPSFTMDDSAVQTHSPIYTEPVLKRSNSLESYFENKTQEDDSPTPTPTPTPTQAVEFFADAPRVVKAGQVPVNNISVETSFVGGIPAEYGLNRTPTFKQKIVKALSPRINRKKTSTSPKDDRLLKSPRLSSEIDKSSSQRQKSEVIKQSRGNSAPYVDATGALNVASVDMVPMALNGSPGAKKEICKEIYRIHI